MALQSNGKLLIYGDTGITSTNALYSQHLNSYANLTLDETPEVCLDLGALKHASCRDGLPIIRIERRENYANQESAKGLTLTIYKAVCLPRNSPSSAARFSEETPSKVSSDPSPQPSAISELTAKPKTQQTGSHSDSKGRVPHGSANSASITAPVLTLIFEFKAYSQMNDLYWLIDEIISQKHTSKSEQYCNNLKVYGLLLSNQFDFWRFNSISEEHFLSNVDTGDILLFRCNS